MNKKIDTSEYDDYINEIAKELSHDDIILIEELRSEMYIYLLVCLKRSKGIVVFSEEMDKQITKGMIRKTAIDYLNNKGNK